MSYKDEFGEVQIGYESARLPKEKRDMRSE